MRGPFRGRTAERAAGAGDVSREGNGLAGPACPRGARVARTLRVQPSPVARRLRPQQLSLPLSCGGRWAPQQSDPAGLLSYLCSIIQSALARAPSAQSLCREVWGLGGSSWGLPTLRSCRTDGGLGDPAGSGSQFWGWGGGEARWVVVVPGEGPCSGTLSSCLVETTVLRSQVRSTEALLADREDGRTHTWFARPGSRTVHRKGGIALGTHSQDASPGLSDVLGPRPELCKDGVSEMPGGKGPGSPYWLFHEPAT